MTFDVLQAVPIGRPSIDFPQDSPDAVVAAGCRHLLGFLCKCVQRTLVVVRDRVALLVACG